MAWQPHGGLCVVTTDDLFLDIGANVGSYTVFASARGARIIAAEPIPATARHLQRNVAVNEITDRVQINPRRRRSGAGNDPLHDREGHDEPRRHERRRRVDRSGRDDP